MIQLARTVPWGTPETPTTSIGMPFATPFVGTDRPVCLATDPARYSLLMEITR